MDNMKIGKLIYQLRKEKGYTQQSLANLLNVSNKTISKWECGLGCPDITLWENLANVLGTNLLELLNGELRINQHDYGKLKNIKFYVCPVCHNIITSTGNMSVSCCGRKLLCLQKNEATELYQVSKEIIDLDYFYTIQHEMSKNHYILFVAAVYLDRVLIIRLYPEQAAEFRLPISLGKYSLYIYCVNDGLQEIKEIN